MTIPTIWQVFESPINETITVNDIPGPVCTVHEKKKNGSGSCRPEKWLKNAENWLKSGWSFHDFHNTYNLTSFLSLILMRQLLLMTTLAQCALCMKRKKR